MSHQIPRIALVGGIYGKSEEYRKRFCITPETTLEAGLRASGADVSSVSHHSAILGEFDVIHVHHLSWGAMRAAVDRSRAAFVFTAHNGQDMAGTLSRARQRAMAFAIRRADGIIALSDFEAAFLRSRYDTGGADASTIPNGIESSQYTMSRSNGAGRDGRWGLLYVGQLVPLKRVDLLLHAVARVARSPGRTIDLSLVYQNAELEGELRELARQLGLEAHVRFLGSKSPPELCALYNDADLFVLPSASEALPSVITEAMMTGTPVVATDTGGVRGQLGGFGRLVPPNDLEGLAHVIEDVLLHYEEVSATSAKMSAYARTRFSRSAMLEKHLELYARVMALDVKRRHRWTLRPMSLLVESLLNAGGVRSMLPRSKSSSQKESVRSASHNETVGTS